ncbi:glycosyl transferase family 1 [Chthonobacter rhizosphaerae]|uniref:glycosyl transferase family 1 n=1 Tax=Chthonobacter rhizosphaerae TaxID=2735553 RepID=UPI0015EF2166|nr:glycosyl transferase family 1 [Chthonobacter rhizosphaerae]
MASALRIAYLVHNTHDAAVLRRVRMFQLGGATVEVAGFRRSDAPPKPLGGVRPVDLGRTRDYGFVHRSAAIGRAGLRRDSVTEMVARADIVVARSLELLAYAASQARLARKPVPIVYESLDIHRLLLSKGPVGTVLRTLETALAKRSALLITSSPGFVRNYFAHRDGLKSLPVLLLENKLLLETADLPELPAPAPLGPPWRIGWFGALRDSKSFDLLTRVTEKLDGKLKVVMRGIPTEAEFPNGLGPDVMPPHIEYRGRYVYPDDITDIYSDVHFTWAVDFFEEGLNSNWLLPNRIYEGGLNNAVPIALGSVETGRMLQRLGTGVIVENDLETTLVNIFSSLTPERYLELRARAAAVPRSNWVTMPADCAALVDRLSEVVHHPRRRHAS